MTATKHIYFIEAGDGGPIKIGVTKDIDKRIKQLQPGTTAPLRLLASIPGSHADERTLHRYFAVERRNGEWFSGGGAVRAFAMSIPSMTPDEVVAAVRAMVPVKPPKPLKPGERTRRYVLAQQAIVRREAEAEKRRRRITRSEFVAQLLIGHDNSIYRSPEIEAAIGPSDLAKVLGVKFDKEAA